MFWEASWSTKTVLGLGVIAVTQAILRAFRVRWQPIRFQPLSQLQWDLRAPDAQSFAYPQGQSR